MTEKLPKKKQSAAAKSETLQTGVEVFISWSGDRSKRVAEAMQEWLVSVIQTIEKPWMSSDIPAGARWGDDLARQLKNAKIGILCMTSENIESMWIHFEAGALSQTVATPFACPYLLDLEPTSLKGPLVGFQANRADEEGTRHLVLTLNNALAEKSLPQERVTNSFEKWWPDLKQKLNQISQLSAEKSKPQRSKEEMIQENLELTRAIYGLIRQSANNVEWPANLERLQSKYKAMSFRDPRSTQDFSRSEVPRLKIDLMKGVQHSVYAIYQIEPYLPLPQELPDGENYFEENKRALERIRNNHPLSTDGNEYTIHRIFIVSSEALSDPKRMEQIKASIDAHCRAGFSIRIALKEDLEELILYEIAIFDDEIALRISIDHHEKRYGEGVVYFDDAVIRDVYLRRYREIAAQSYLPKEFWDKYQQKA